MLCELERIRSPVEVPLSVAALWPISIAAEGETVALIALPGQYLPKGTPRPGQNDAPKSVDAGAETSNPPMPRMIRCHGPQHLANPSLRRPVSTCSKMSANHVEARDEMLCDWKTDKVSVESPLRRLWQP